MNPQPFTTCVGSSASRVYSSLRWPGMLVPCSAGTATNAATTRSTRDQTPHVPFSNGWRFAELRVVGVCGAAWAACLALGAVLRAGTEEITERLQAASRLLTVLARTPPHRQEQASGPTLWQLGSHRFQVPSVQLR